MNVAARFLATIHAAVALREPIASVEWLMEHDLARRPVGFKLVFLSSSLCVSVSAAEDDTVTVSDQWPSYFPDVDVVHRSLNQAPWNRLESARLVGGSALVSARGDVEGIQLELRSKEQRPLSLQLIARACTLELRWVLPERA